MRIHFKSIFLLLIPLFLIILVMAGCGKKEKRDLYMSQGMDDGVDGFLFNFDQRAEVVSLVNFHKQKQYPEKVTWYYEKNTTDQDVQASAVPEDPHILTRTAGGGTQYAADESGKPRPETIIESLGNQTEAASESMESQVEIASESTENQAEISSESIESQTETASERINTQTEAALEDMESLTEVSSEKEKTMEEKAVSSMDADTIREIYYALSNTIIIGVAKDQSDDVRYFISFTLPDGEECRFDFISETTIRLSQQNYVAEFDGNLWNILTAANPAADFSS